MNYGFVIDNRTCIGCHACSTACKAENDVPLGVYRTWVKYVEKGAFPDTRRFFQVTRCNHCANPPCVRICPVEAMYQRDDGIVDFDPEVCIGCKACLQACPYDAIYIDPDSHTAAKCHYCAHRTEIGLEPACVVVCPEQAIIAGDLDDPNSHISQLVARHTTSVRKPEQGTAPKLFYIDAEEAALTPGAAAHTGSYAFAEVATDQARAVHAANGHSTREPDIHRHSPTGAAVRAVGAQGMGRDGPLYVGQTRIAEQMVQTAYNAQHRMPWHWQVPAYLVTKAVAAGLALLLAGLAWTGLLDLTSPLALWGVLAALAATGATTALLVLDLDRPARFYTILTRPQWGSWLTRGAFVLIAFTLALGAWLLLAAGVAGGQLPAAWLAATDGPLLALSAVLAVLTAAYTAFLFGQAEGRDLWQSPLLPAHLVVQAVLAGAAALLLIGSALGGAAWSEVAPVAAWALGLSLVADLLLTLGGELGMPHASESAARAAHMLTHGRYRVSFWAGAIGLGHVLALALLPVAPAAAAVAALVGLYLYERAFVYAPQEIPNA